MKTFNEATLRKILEVANLEPEDRGDYFKIFCPSCGQKEAFIYKDSRLIICSRKNKCNYSNDVIAYAKEEGKLRKDVLKSITPKVEKKEEVKEKAKLAIPEGLTFFSDATSGIMYDKAINYLRSRGVAEKLIQQMGYVYDPNRLFELGVFIPFFENGELVYYILRNVDKLSPLRYDNPRGINASSFVFNYDNIREGDTICVVEGVFDAISIQNYIGTAMLTSSMSRNQASKLFDKAPSKIIYIPDNDETGERYIDKNINMMIRYKPPSLDTEFYIYRIPSEYKDFSEYAEKGGGFIDFNDCKEYSHIKKEFTIKRKSPL